ncbi:MAG: hemerythrin domain-containing protein [Propionibacteriaceae bacterium]
MTDARLAAWGQQLRLVHQRLRDGLRLAREAVEDGADPESISGDVQLFCVGFCVALDGHHTSEDTSLFPIVLEQRPDLAPVVAQLKQDHSMLSHLIAELQHALQNQADEESLLRHLDGIEAVMTTHFRYEERRLVELLDGVEREGLDKRALFGPLA